jgi:mono/diheme cytochrome c family protein
MRNHAVLSLFMVIDPWPISAWANTPSLTVSFGTDTRRFSVGELLARPDARTLQVPEGVGYGRSMTYRAVPLLALLPPAALNGIDTIEARATDGFVAQIPAELVRKGANGGSVPWIAVEDPVHPWPTLPGKAITAGPFFLVWEHPERSGVTIEQWPYALAELRGVEPPAQRWPQILVDARVPADAPARRGQAVFITQCMPCHRMNGAGEGVMGPDLNRPMNPTDYVTPAGLHALIRNPKNVRTWPMQQMVGFDAAVLPDPDVDALIAYLKHMASQPSQAGK